jgi:GT2 family glycosyltransferase
MFINIGIVLYAERLDPALYQSILTAAALAPDELQLKLNVWINSPMIDPAHLQQYPEVATLSDSRENIGFASAQNNLMKAAFAGEADYSPDFHLCLNPDTLLDPYFFQEAWSVLAANLHNITLLEGRQFPFEHPKPYDPFTGVTPWCTGAALFINGDTFRATQGFDQRFFLYCEDVDLSWRVRALGGVCRLIPRARLFHDMRIDGAKPAAIRRLMLEGGRRLAAKWGAPEFVEWAEATMVNDGLVPARSSLEPLIVAPPDPAFAVTDFRHHLSFGFPRW